MRRPRKSMNQINVVPYIDVMLVLLVIFMVTAPLVTPGVVDLPSVSKAPVAPMAPLEVIIKEDQSVLLRSQRTSEPSVMVDGARRAMRATYQREMDHLESHLAFLASTGSVSPYVGLFGTVWGIMHAFRSLSNVQAATLAQVAPGIAEALIATAIGLFAAIPAVVAYNRYTHDVDRLSVRFETFIEEFSNILQRQG